MGTHQLLRGHLFRSWCDACRSACFPGRCFSADVNRSLQSPHTTVLGPFGTGGLALSTGKVVDAVMLLAAPRHRPQGPILSEVLEIRAVRFIAE